VRKSTAILLFVLGCLLLLAIEFFRVYLIMPFPGSQQADTVRLAWSIDHYRLPLRLLGLLLVIFPLIRFWRHGRIAGKIALSALILFYGVIFYFFNFRFEADKMFYQPTTKVFENAAGNKIPLDKLVIGVVINNEAKAYPIQVIGYHHQVRDTVGNTPVMITYCTVCRTGRVYSPAVDGKLENFRLVGMDHFNAMFEDATTKSWWQQATGVSVAGPLRDHRLAELPSQQLTLAQWLTQYPNSGILQPDTVFRKHYAALALYDNGTIEGGLEHRDSASWKPKSWVVGVRSGELTKAYDWNSLVQNGLIQDTIGATPVLLLLGRDTTSFQAWNRQIQGQTLEFTKLPDQPLLVDNTGGQWDLEGHCTNGRFKDQQLQRLQSYQEFWHSWSHFHPATTQYKL
jgi:Protein of unknown function (DUF3179)